MRTGINTVFIGMACVMLINLFSDSTVCLFLLGKWRFVSSWFSLVVYTVVFCGTLEICWFVSLTIIDDSANDMAATNISHLNNVINGLEERTFQLRLVG